MLERNRALAEKWYELFVDRIPLLVPVAKKMDGREILVDDVVLFLFQDPGTPKMWTWKLGIVTARKSRSTYEIRYVGTAGSTPRLIERSLRQICLIHGVDEIPPMSVIFTDDEKE